MTEHKALEKVIPGYVQRRYAIFASKEFKAATPNSAVLRNCVEQQQQAKQQQQKQLESFASSSSSSSSSAPPLPAAPVAVPLGPPPAPAPAPTNTELQQKAPAPAPELEILGRATTEEEKKFAEALEGLKISDDPNPLSAPAPQTSQKADDKEENENAEEQDEVAESGDEEGAESGDEEDDDQEQEKEEVVRPRRGGGSRQHKQVVEEQDDEEDRDEFSCSSGSESSGSESGSESESESESEAEEDEKAGDWNKQVYAVPSSESKRHKKQGRLAREIALAFAEVLKTTPMFQQPSAAPLPPTPAVPSSSSMSGSGDPSMDRLIEELMQPRSGPGAAGSRVPRDKRTDIWLKVLDQMKRELKDHDLDGDVVSYRDAVDDVHARLMRMKREGCRDLPKDLEDNLDEEGHPLHVSHLSQMEREVKIYDQQRKNDVESGVDDIENVVYLASTALDGVSNMAAPLFGGKSLLGRDVPGRMQRFLDNDRSRRLLRTWVQRKRSGSAYHDEAKSLLLGGLRVIAEGMCKQAVASGLSVAHDYTTRQERKHEQHKTGTHPANVPIAPIPVPPSSSSSSSAMSLDDTATTVVPACVRKQQPPPPPPPIQPRAAAPAAAASQKKTEVPPPQYTRGTEKAPPAPAAAGPATLIANKVASDLAFLSAPPALNLQKGSANDAMPQVKSAASVNLGALRDTNLRPFVRNLKETTMRDSAAIKKQAERKQQAEEDAKEAIENASRHANSLFKNFATSTNPPPVPTPTPPTSTS